MSIETIEQVIPILIVVCGLFFCALITVDAGRFLNTVILLIVFATTICGASMATYRHGYYDGKEASGCPTCQECGYRLPGLDLIDSVETVTDKETLRAIAMAETRGRHYVVIRGAAGEVGMMQIHPIHGDECYGIGDTSIAGNNLRCGDLIFQNCMKKTNGDRKAALCCYNGASYPCEYADKL